MFFLYYFDRILILAAIVPAIFLLVKIYQADRSEKEPPQLLGSLILRGVFATMIAIVLERLGDRLLPRWMDPYSLEYQLVENFLIVGLAEEGSKYCLMKGRTWNSPAFNYSFDAVVYGAFVSLGFALWENISYVMMYGLDVAVLRAVTAIPGHACFGVFMGAWYGAAKRQDGFGNRGASAFCRAMALLFPALLHGLYDFTAMLDGSAYRWAFYGYIAALFVSAFLTVRRLSRNDAPIPNSVFRM